MLCRRVDVPCYGQQTLAFPVDRSRLRDFRDALRAVLEAGDLGPMRALWVESWPAYRAERERTRWRVPAVTVLDTCRRARSLAGELDRADLDARVSELESSLGEGEAVDVLPEAWFGVESFRDIERLRRHGLGDLMDGYLEMLVEALAHLREDVAPAWAQQIPEAPSDEDLRWIARLHFRSEGQSVATPTQEPTSAMRDGLVLPPDIEIPDGIDSPWQLQTHLERWVSAWSVLETLVGPFRESRGPGPFRDFPDAAEALESPEWSALPIFRAGREDDPLFRSWLCDAGVLEAAALDEAAAEIRAAEPHRAWWGEEEIESFDEIYAFDAARPWLSWPSVRSWWPRCRDRFLGLLEECARDDRAVILIPFLPDDQGPTATPAGPEDGEPVTVART